MLKYLQLTRPRIVVMVLFSLAVAAWTSGDTAPAWQRVVHAVLGLALITAGSVALNQWYEQRSDALMARTQGRPIPSGRVPSGRALAFGVGLSVAGLAYLAWLVDPVVALWAGASWIFYVACYTPLKSRSAWQLPVGAVAGAMPILIGGAVAEALGDPLPWVLFAIVFLWQFPHALAIGWLYRDQYARAGLRVAAVVDPTGRLAGRLATAGALLLLPISLLPVVLQQAAVWFALWAGACGVVYLVLAVQFWRERTDRRARQMLRASFVYLPVVLTALLLTAVR
ncbi:MAG: heme o synthase [Pirellulaceae bacterium]|nr:heme o synthase [Pirellulaceae bacterium]